LPPALPNVVCVTRPLNSALSEPPPLPLPELSPRGDGAAASPARARAHDG